MDTPIILHQPDAPAETTPKVQNRLEKISFIVFLVTILLTPFAFVPTAYAPVETMKMVVISFGVLISALLYCISAFQNKTLYFSKHPLFLSAVALVISLVASMVMSTHIIKSFIGQGFELGTTSMMLVFFVASLLVVYLTHKDRDRVLYIFGALIVSFVILALYHLVRIFVGADVMTFGVFNTITSTMLGKWTDFALYAGVMAIVSYISICFINLSRLFKALLVSLLVLSLLVLIVVNFTIAWTVLALMFAGIAFYQFSLSKTSGQSLMKRIPLFSLTLLLVAGVFAWKGDVISQPIIEKFSLGYTEIVLPWQPTLDVISDSIKTSPIFGAGPNRFMSEYLLNKPEGVNPSIAWNVEFNTGFGLIPSTLVTQGLFGIIAWIIFIILFAYAGFKALKSTQDTFSRFFIGSTFFTSFFLWIVNLVYVPSHFIVLVTFVITGLFFASLVTEGYASLTVIGNKDGSLMKKIRGILMIVLIVVCFTWLLVYIKKTTALGYFEGGIAALNSPEANAIERAEKNFRNALAWDASDIHYQALSEINIVKINAIAQQIQASGQATADESVLANVRSLIEEGVQHTRNAIAFDPANYYNYISEARISELAMSLGTENAYENTITAYGNALKYNPSSPLLYLSLARIEATQEKYAEAQQYIGASLQLKPNYLEAIFLLSQIQVSQGKIKDAITSVQVASQINPTNPLIFFQLGLLYYNDKNYKEAVTSFEKALELNSEYANAQYFLGLSHARLGRTADAIVQFEKLADTNPDNEEIILILSNLKAGKSPFADAQPPIDSTPEQRKTLPVEEKATKNN
jgi:tetratricopeptide (TPR) repeat protein